MSKTHQGERIVLASSNKGKVREINQLLAQQRIEVVPQVPPLGFPAPSHTKYTFSLGNPTPPTAIEYLLIATPTGDQAKDKEKGEDCDPLRLNQSNFKDPPECW